MSRLGFNFNKIHDIVGKTLRTANQDHVTANCHALSSSFDLAYEVVFEKFLAPFERRDVCMALLHSDYSIYNPLTVSQTVRYIVARQCVLPNYAESLPRNALKSSFVTNYFVALLLFVTSNFVALLLFP